MSCYVTRVRTCVLSLSTRSLNRVFLFSSKWFVAMKKYDAHALA